MEVGDNAENVVKPTSQKKGEKRKSFTPKLHSYKKPKWEEGKCDDDDDNNGNRGGQVTQFGIPIGYEG